MNDNRRICLGAFAGAHGVKGAAKVRTFTERERNIAEYGPVESENGARCFTLDFIRILKPGLALVAAPEIESREDAAALAGTRLYVNREFLPELGDDDFYIEDLTGLAAIDDAGARLGRIVAIHEFGAGPVVEIEDESGNAILVPFTRAAVPEIDIDGGQIVVSTAALAEIEAGGAS
ncbi:MAG: ribosome maturation factor RimM [Parvularculaceae bacterium]|nr:16S rRNA processing protein RimM [Parvularculaceae bacterium]